MTRHDLAKLRFDQLVRGLTHGADEERSDQLEAWLRDDVVPVVEDLLDNPVFRRRIREIPKQLFTSPPQHRRASIDALADALVAEAQALVAVAHEFELIETLADHDRARDQGWIAEQANRRVDTRSVIEKLAERPWFNVVNPDDFWNPTLDLHLKHSDPLLARQYRRGQPQGKLLGDHVIEQMFVRFDFWKKRLERGRQKLQSQLGGDKSRFAAHERMLPCAIDVEKQYQAVQCDLREGNDARMRNACLVLLQTYIAYHEVPQLRWLGVDLHELAVRGRIVRSFFRHQGTLHLVEQKGDGQLQQVGTRSASLVDLQLIRQVGGALEDLATLYHQGVHLDDLIAEAIDEFRLVVVVNPRMVFWNGTLIDVPWDTADKNWNLLLHLAVKKEGKLPVRDFKLTGVANSRDETVRKSHLVQFLSRTPAGLELAALIDKPRGGKCGLDLKPTDVRVLDLDADNWTVDVSEFRQANSSATPIHAPESAMPGTKAKPR